VVLEWEVRICKKNQREDRSNVDVHCRTWIGYRILCEQLTGGWERTWHLHWNNCAGFPSMPVSHSKSPFSCITSILEPLHHTRHSWLCHSLLQGLEDSNHPRVGDFAVIHTKLSLAIVLSRSQKLENGTAFYLQFVNARLHSNLSKNWDPQVYSPSTMTTKIAQCALVLVFIKARYKCLVVLYCIEWDRIRIG